MTDSKHWTLAFAELDLTDAERAIVQRLVSTPRSRSFLPAAEILKKSGKINECIELLTIGLEWHPSYSAARVTLARELFNQGMMEETWEHLHREGDYLGGNFLAQKLKLQTAIVLGMESEARAICDSMVAGGIFDDDIELIHQKLSSLRFAVVRAEWMRLLEDKGIKILPLSAPAGTVSPRGQEMSAEDDGLERTKGFYVAPVKQIFAPGGGEEPIRDLAGCELDTMTLAELYERQGHYGKALEIYRRLATLSTQNEMFRRKISELSAQMHLQREADFKVDPLVVKKMQKIEVIDSQIAYLHRLLDRLG